MDADYQDRLLKFLREFASMAEDERDAAIEALSPADRDALVALAEARTATAAVDLIEILDSGQGGLDKLHELDQPGELFTVINLAIRERPNLVVEALFAAVVLRRGWDRNEPTAIVALREAWHWHVHEQLEAARHADDHPAT